MVGHEARHVDGKHGEGKRPSRRTFVGMSSAVAAGTLLASRSAPAVHIAEDNTIRLAIIGTGGRGSGAVANALDAGGKSVKLYAMADLFEDRLQRSYRALADRYGDRIDVPSDRRFLGFDAYRRAIDCLRPGSGDIVLLTAYSYVRPLHMEYAVQRGVHVFMEKPFAPDPAGLHRLLRAGEIADKKNLKVAAGLMCRHSSARQALIDRIRNGDLGEIPLVRAYRMNGGSRLGKRPARFSELEWQIRRRVFFPWIGSGRFIELLIHQIDECCWIKDAWPVAAHGLGGRAADNHCFGQNLDTYAVEYAFADGSRARVDYRGIPRCYNAFATFVHGTKCAAQFSGNIHAPTVHTYQGHTFEKDRIAWRAPQERTSPYLAEWRALLEAIRRGTPHNETKRAVYADFASIMGRAAVHMGRWVTWDEVVGSRFAFCPDVDHLTFDSQPPVKAGPDGRYPVPVPGQWNEV